MKVRFCHFDQIDSTNDEAKRLAELGEPEGTVVTAESQTAGRGRSGRAWITPPGRAIAMSIILRPIAPALHLTQIALLGGLAVLEGIQRVAGLPAQIKWPNDVLVRGKKVAGVLAEAAFRGEGVEYVVLGVGVNVNGGPPPDLQLDYEAVSLADELGCVLDRDSVRDAILAALEVRYSQLGTAALTAAWAEHLAMRGAVVRVTGMLETITGTLEAVKEDGTLVLRQENGSARTVLAGDVHLRRG